MKILFANIPTPYNHFMIDLKTALENYAEVIWDYNEFWNCENHYDIVHIHWPEYLSFEIEKYLSNSDPFPKELWDRIKKCYEHWSKNSILIYTRHVQGPHARFDEEFQNLYRFSASYCKAVVHFANYSIQQFKNFYPELTHVQHFVIPHHNYISLPNSTNKSEARKKLNIKENAKVMLVFGSIKEHEKKLIKEAFSFIPGSNKVLLAPGWKLNKPRIKWIRLREWVFKIKILALNIYPKYHLNKGIIVDSEAQYYCKAADFLFIPRTNELNSGNITFGFTFGLVVVGKDTADIGEILNETGNPTFKVGDQVSLKNAVISAIKLSNNGYGKQNQRLALSNWNPKDTAQQYMNVFKKQLDK